MSTEGDNRSGAGDRNLTVGHLRTLAARLHVSPEVFM